jgi:hypothetical protein
MARRKANIDVRQCSRAPRFNNAGCFHILSAMRRVMAHRPRSSKWPQPLKSASAVGLALLVSAFLAFPASAHTHARPQSKAIIATAIQFSRAYAAAACGHPASTAQATSTVQGLAACHEGCGGCDSCAYCSNCCASSSCSGGHGYALLSDPIAGPLVTTWRLAAPPLDEIRDGLAPPSQFEPPRA